MHIDKRSVPVFRLQQGAIQGNQNVCVCVCVCANQLSVIFLALQPTVMLTAAFLGNGDKGEYMLSRKLLITQQGVLKPHPHNTVRPSPSDTHPTLPLEKVGPVLCCKSTLSGSLS